MVRSAEDSSRDASFPWHRVLPAAGAVVALLLIGLAALTARGFRERQELLLEGRLLRQAHEAEAILRDAEPEAAADELLREALSHGPAEGLRLLAPDGTVEAETGAVGNSARLEVQLFLGRGGGGRGGGPRAGPPGPGRGPRTLQMFAPPVVAGPWPARLLLPTAVVVSLALVGLAGLAGRLLLRERHRAGEAATRRRLDSLARAGAGLAHQLRTPLATAKGSLQLLQERFGGERRFAVVLAQLDRMERLLDELLDYGRPPEPAAVALELGPALAEAAAVNSRVRVGAVPAGLVARVDPEHLASILANLLDNALAAGPDEGEVLVVAAAHPGGVTVEVLDRGPGPGPDPEHLFEPYVTSRASGTGLGLPIARALAEANGGRLTLSPRPGGGSAAILVLPTAGGAA